MAGVAAGLLHHVGEGPADTGRGAARSRPGERCAEVGAGVEHAVRPFDGLPVAGDDVGDAVLGRGPERRRPASHLLPEEDRALDVGQVVEQPEQVGAGRHRRRADLRFGGVLDLAGDRGPQVVEEPAQGLGLTAAGSGRRGVPAVGAGGGGHGDRPPEGVGRAGRGRGARQSL